MASSLRLNDLPTLLLDFQYLAQDVHMQNRSVGAQAWNAITVWFM